MIKLLRFWRLCVLLLLVVSLLLGCGRKQTAESIVSPTVGNTPEAVATDTVAPTPEPAPTSTVEKVETLVVVSADPITTLEPYRMVAVHPEGSIASHLWDTLTLLNDDFQVEPNLAQSWRLINSFTWEFTLRQDVVFSNGEPLNAQAVRFSIERSQSMPGTLETFVQDIGLEKVEVSDEYILRIITTRPVPNLPYHCAFLEVVPPVYYSETALDHLSLAPVGSGPYRLGEWAEDGSLVLEAVPSYWKGTPYWARLEFRSLRDADGRLGAVQEGRADLVTDLTPVQAANWDPSSGRLAAIESAQRMFVGIRVPDEGPLADERVRQALNYGVNVTAIVENRLNGYGERYGSWVSPPAGNEDLGPWPYDPERARRLLGEAGYAEGFTTTLHVPIGTYYQGIEIAHDIAEQLSQIGVTANVEEIEWLSYVSQLLSEDPPSLFYLAMNSRGDGLQDVRNLSVSFAYNPTGWEDDLFERKLDRAAGTFNENAQARLLDEVQAIAYDQAPWIWLWRSYLFYGVRGDLEWAPRPDGLVNLYRTSGAYAQSAQ